MSIFDEHRKEVKEKIYNAAISLFQSKGYEKTSILEITEFVGMAKGTFYNFYASKTDVLFAWAQNVFNNLNIEETIKTGRTTEQNLYLLVDIITKAIEESQGLFRTFLYELLRLQGDEQQTKSFDFITLYESILRNSSDGNGILADDAETKVEMINSVLFMGIINWFDKHAESKGLSSHLKKSVKLLINGIL
ncbi:MAG TPA: TetR/AcrR family transcriptional regulator [Ignavibacteriales bacterium]|nr:TetR/AcrR family transcriptional regulator [Ignavibacteriales bacterium]